MTPPRRLYIAGHTGLIGSALVRRFAHAGTDDLIVRTHAELDLTDATAVDAFFDSERPQYVILAAGRVGGIVDNLSYPADFLTANLAIQLNVLRAAQRTGVERLILFASSCMYPRECPQPMNGAGGRKADKGEGWFARNTWWRSASMRAALPCAWAPHSKNTLGRSWALS